MESGTPFGLQYLFISIIASDLSVTITDIFDDASIQAKAHSGISTT